MTTKPPSTTFMFWYTPIVNWSAPSPTRSDAANHNRSKNRTSLDPTWSKVDWIWCHGVSSSGVSRGASSRSGGRRETRRAVAEQLHDGRARVVALDDHRHGRDEQCAQVAIVRV